MLRLTCLLLLASAVVALELKSQLNDHWKSFKKVHLKSYASGEEEKRKEIFKKSVETVLQHNLRADLGLETNKLAINMFADMTDEEIERSYMGLAPAPPEAVVDQEEDVQETREDYPDKVDWRESGFVNTPKSQGSCGSCWAFAAASVVETYYGLATGEHVTLSEQMLLDCAVNGGCSKGGNPLGGFYYMIGKGIMSSECYPYKQEKSDSCQYDSSCVVAKISSHKSISKGSENVMKKIVATKGPLSVTMYANPRQLSLHKYGMYNPESCNATSNHAVVIVGYGTTESGQDYWLVRNSWGPTWGEDGYFKIPRNAGSKCNIANDVRYPVV